jgi:predicted peroxiredoxin
MAKTAFVVNGPTGASIGPALILGSAAAALGDDVVVFCAVGGAPTMVKGELEKMGGKGLPNFVELYDGLRTLGGRVIVCELALEAKDMKAEDFREGVEIGGATSFLSEIRDATITFSF